MYIHRITAQFIIKAQPREMLFSGVKASNFPNYCTLRLNNSSLLIVMSIIILVKRANFKLNMTFFKNKYSQRINIVLVNIKKPRVLALALFP